MRKVVLNYSVVVSSGGCSYVIYRLFTGDESSFGGVWGMWDGYAELNM